ncbi:MAG: polysulfide reductase NrfD [Anaerolineae bacterium]|nr:polysulfide reductase NrfD [Anaerolineae bacterium]
MTWEWQTAVYLWVAGIAGGAYLAAFLVNVFGYRRRDLVRRATYVGVPLVILGTLLLVYDLGKPLRAWHLFLSFRANAWEVVPGVGVASLRGFPPNIPFYPGSPMSMGSWILFLFIAIGVVMAVLWAAESSEGRGILGWLQPLAPVAGILSWVMAGLSVLLIAYTGVLLSATNQPLWAGALLLPALFVISAVATGTALLLLVEALRGRDIPHVFGRAAATLAVLEVIALAGFLLTVPSVVLVTGSLSPWFWGGVVVVGLLVPFGLELYSARKMMAPLMIASTLCVLLGGLVLRMVVVIGGQV